ncbi:MAG TPA: hypothetical protein VHL11_17910 [Phototrophicaceae bacterium]|nr:hypothetical protein [Phototrophicaceae bacterium]
MPNGQYFTIAGTYLDNPVLPIHIAGSPQVKLGIYQTSIDMLMNQMELKDNYYPYYGPFNLRQLYSRVYRYTSNKRIVQEYPHLPWVSKENLISQTTQTFISKTEDGETVYLPLRDANDQLLPVGDLRR